MIRKVLILCSVLMLFFSVVAGAEQKEKNSHVSLGFQTYYHEYKEPGVMKNKGWFNGITYSTSYDSYEKNF